MRRAGFILPILVLASPVWAGEVSLTDAFDGKGNVTWVVPQGQWEMRDGRYHVSGVGQAFVEGMAFDDVSVQVDCRIADHGPILADWVGVIVGGESSTGSTKGYLVYLRYSGEVELYRAGRIIAAKMTAARARFDAGQSVRLDVEVKGHRITVRVDGEAMIEEDAPEYQWGDVGLAAYDVEGNFDNFDLRGDRLQNMIFGQVLYAPSYEPAPGARVEIYNSMDGYDSPVTRETTADEQGRFAFRDLPSGEKAYWLRTGEQGYGGTTAWFVTVSESGPTGTELDLVGAPRHDIWIDSADAKAMDGFKLVQDMQCFGGSRIEVKEARSAARSLSTDERTGRIGPRTDPMRPLHRSGAGERPEWRAEFAFEAPRAGDYTPHLAAGLYPTPHYWSDYWWSIDGKGPFRASETLTIEGPRYGDRSTLVWAFGPPQRLTAGTHALTVILRDPAPHNLPKGQEAYWWSFDAAALAEAAALIAPIAGGTLRTARPELRWRAPESAARFTVQYSEEPDFSNGTVTIAEVTADRLRPRERLADGTYYWRVKALTQQETPFTSAFTRAGRFVVSTEGPGISDIRVASRGPNEAVIEWRTDEPCTGAVRYGPSALGFTRTAAARGRASERHRVRLTGLEPMTHYYYAVEAKDRDGNAARSLRRGLCTKRGAIDDANSPFGIFGQGLMFAEQMGQAGAKWYSDYWMWQNTEPGRGTFNWQEAEERMKRAEDAGVRLMVTFWGTPAWTRPRHPTQFTYGPDDLQDARDFFRQVAAHCAGRTNWWLPWIEPNVARDTTFGFPEGYWANRPHARSYAAYQRAAYEGAKAGDPDCRVVGMNTAGVDLEFIRKCYDEGAADSFDVMNVHYYAITAPFEEQHPEELFARLRALMAEYGDSEKPILCSEGGGASSNLPGTNEDTQADNLIRIYVISIANHIDRLCWTFERDVKPYDSKRVDMIMWMGLFRFDPAATAQHPVGEAKPSYAALKAMTDNLYGTEYDGLAKVRTSSDAPVRAYRFVGEGRRVTVAWAERGEAEVELPVRARRVVIVDRAGRERTAEANGGVLRLHVTGSPVFVREEAADGRPKS